MREQAAAREAARAARNAALRRSEQGQRWTNAAETFSETFVFPASGVVCRDWPMAATQMNLLSLEAAGLSRCNANLRLFQAAALQHSELAFWVARNIADWRAAGGRCSAVAAAAGAADLRGGGAERLAPARGRRWDRMSGRRRRRRAEAAGRFRRLHQLTPLPPVLRWARRPPPRPAPKRARRPDPCPGFGAGGRASAGAGRAVRTRRGLCACLHFRGARAGPVADLLSQRHVRRRGVPRGPGEGRTRIAPTVVNSLSNPCC